MSPLSASVRGCEPQARRVGVVDVDARDARRDAPPTRRRSATSPRPPTTRYLNEAVTGAHRQAERAGLLGRHLRDAPAIAVRDLHLRDDRRAVADQPRLNRQRRARLDLRALPGVTSSATRSGNSVSAAASTACRAGPRREEQHRRERRAAPRAACARPGAATRSETIVSMLDRRRSRRAASASIGSASRRADAPTRRGHVDGAHQAIVERRRALFDEARHLAVVGHVAQRQQITRSARRRPSAPQRCRPARASDRRAVRPARSATTAVPTTAAAAISAPRTIAASARSARHRARTRIDQVANGLVAVGHGTTFVTGTGAPPQRELADAALRICSVLRRHGRRRSVSGRPARPTYPDPHCPTCTGLVDRPRRRTIPSPASSTRHQRQRRTATGAG